MKLTQQRNILFTIFTLILSSLLTGCTTQEPTFECNDELGCVSIAKDAPIKIGVLQAISGDIAPLGEAQIRGLELALEKRGGRIFGHPVKLQTEDTGCTSEGGANAALRIIANPQSVAIFGTTCSGAAATAAKVMSDAGLSMVSGNNSAPFLTSIAGKKAPSWQPGYFRTAPNEEHAGAVAAAFVFHEHGIKRAATINDTDIYTRGLTESFQKAFIEYGGEIVLDTAVNKGDSQMLPVLTAVVNSSAEALFFPLFQPEGNHLLLQARKLPSLAQTLLISNGALIQKSFIEMVGELGKGMYFVGPAMPTGDAVEQLRSAYLKKYNEKPSVSYYLSGFDAADLLLHAIETSAQQGKDGTLYVGRQKLRATLYAITKHKGVTGELTCDQFGDCAQPAFKVLRLDDPKLGLKGLEKNIVYPLTF